MALLSLLAVVVCELLLRLQSTRINRVMARELQRSGHSEDGDLTAAASDEKLLACEEKGFSERIIIQDKDKALVEYDYAVDALSYGKVWEVHETSTIKCKTFTKPPEPSLMLRNLTTPTLPEDVLGLITANLNHNVSCVPCQLLSFNMSFLERCRTALTQNQWVRVHIEVKEEGGSCQPIMSWEERTLQTCMTSPKANQVAVCRVQSAASGLVSIKAKERIIKADEDAIQTVQEVTKKNNQGHQEFDQPTAGVAFQREIKTMQDLIKQKQDNVEDLQDVLDMHNYLKQIFEGL